MSTELTRTGPKDMLAALRTNAVEVYRRAYKGGAPLSVFLEKEVHGEDAFKPQADGLDAFERMLKEANVKTRSFEELGVWSDTYGDFEDRAKPLIPEWIRRVWREASGRRVKTTRAVYSSDDTALNTLSRPVQDAAGIREDVRIAPAIPVSELVAMTTPVQGDAYRSFYLTNNAANQRLVRVGETAEIPTAKLQSSEKTIRLLKYGRGLEASYEVLRRQPIDRIRLHIQRMAVQSEADKVGTVLDVIVNGDGSSGSAAEVFNLTALDSAASAGTLTAKGWLAFQKKFAAPYTLTTILMQEAPVIQFELLNIGSANMLLAVNAANVNSANMTPINQSAQNVRYGWTADAPALKIVGFDRRFAVGRLVETGGNIQEVERFIKNQTELFTMTEVEGFDTIDNEAAKILDINA